MDGFTALIADQAGVVSRPQLLEVGCAPHDIKRMLRRRDLVRLQPGVYLNHTGEPTWLQRAWSGLFACSGEVDLSDVALAHHSAIRIAEGPGRRGDAEPTIHVEVPNAKKVRATPGVTIHRSRHFAERVQPTLWPPRIRYEQAIVDVATTQQPMEALALLSRVIGERRSTAGRLLLASQDRKRIRGRSWLEAVLRDIDRGTHSVLEHGFLTRVLRPHGLPRPRQQLRETTAIGAAYRDASFGKVVIELDGRLHHRDMERRDADLDRDLAVATTGRVTVRLGWGQVFDRPCLTALALGLVIERSVQPCGPGCPIAQ